jgi:hypothetical protein
MTVLPLDADATSLPSGENATAQTASEWPSSVLCALPVVELEWCSDTRNSGYPTSKEWRKLCSMREVTLAYLDEVCIMIDW